MTSKISAKFFEMFRNLKSDAVPRSPRPEGAFEDEPEAEAHNENVEYPDTHEDIFIGVEGEKKNKKKGNFKKNFFSKSSPDRDKDGDKDRRSSEGSAASSTINTQATGHVINIVNSKDVHMGDEHVYHLNSMDGLFPPFAKRQASYNAEEEPVKMTNLIALLMEADIEVEHEYMDYVSKNLGKNWYSVYRRMGFTQGRIETVELDMAKKGISEARYKLLLDWKRNEDDSTLGRLATLLWEDGERQIVKELAAMYHSNRNN